MKFLARFKFLLLIACLLISQLSCNSDEESIECTEFLCSDGIYIQLTAIAPVEDDTDDDDTDGAENYEFIPGVYTVTIVMPDDNHSISSELTVKTELDSENSSDTYVSESESETEPTLPEELSRLVSFSGFGDTELSSSIKILLNGRKCTTDECEDYEFPEALQVIIERDDGTTLIDQQITPDYIGWWCNSPDEGKCDIRENKSATILLDIEGSEKPASE